MLERGRVRRLVCSKLNQGLARNPGVCELYKNSFSYRRSSIKTISSICKVNIKPNDVSLENVIGKIKLMNPIDFVRGEMSIDVIE